MLRIFKSISFYIYVVLFALVVALGMPEIMMEKMNKPEVQEPVASVSVLNIVRHGDGTYSVVMQDDITHGYDEEQVDSVLISLISEID